MLDDFYFTSKAEQKFTEIDEFILEGIKIIRSKSGLVSKHTIIALAKQYKENQSSCCINITDYFVNGFKERNQVIWKSLYGEYRSACLDNVIDFFSKYNLLKNEYEERNIFNLDETGLFVSNFGNKSYVLKGKDDCKNIKLDKTRVTVVLGFNKFVEELIPILIGKSKKPR